MIKFDVVDFSERRSEEVISFFLHTVYICMNFYFALGPQPPSGGDSRTEWERQQEQEEFSRAAAFYQPMSGLMASRFVRAAHNDADDKVEVPAETGVRIYSTGPVKIVIFTVN